uniref:Crystallin J1B-like n=1 Tax=Poecilia reticulata TaxID=8081 RepID=A0A3P9P1G3_POERE
IKFSISSRPSGSPLTPTAQPMHWIYNPDRLNEVLSDLEPHPEFRPLSANPFYRRTTGEQTCYGDQAYVLLESLSQCGGTGLLPKQGRFYKFFGPGTVYDLPINDPYRKKGGPKAILPIDGPWRNAKPGDKKKRIINSNQLPSYIKYLKTLKLAPVVAMFAGRPEMLEKVESAIRVTQNNDMCVAVTLAAARFLEGFILKGPDPDALDAVVAQLSDPNRKNPQDLDRAVIAHISQVKENLAKASHQLIPASGANDGASADNWKHACGRLCPALPGAFQAALHGVLTMKQLEEAVRDTMRRGGCTASRASFIGACFGAQTGLRGIPESWRKRTLRYPLLLELAENVVSKRQQS